MKNLIVGMAVLLLLIIFPLQSVLDIVNYRRVTRFNECVYTACQKARTSGYFTSDIISELLNEIKDTFPNISDADIDYDLTTTRKYRLDAFDDREVIEYDVAVPIDKIIYANALLGIQDEDNRYTHRVAGYVLSELPMP